MHKISHRSGLAAPFLVLVLFLGGSGLNLQASMLGLRHGGEVRAKDALEKRISDAEVICSGAFVELAGGAEGSFYTKDKEIQGHWYKAKFKINNIIKGTEFGKNLIVRFFAPSHGGSDLFPLPPDRGACLLFLDKSTNVVPSLSIVPSPDPILSLPDSPVVLEGVSNVCERLRAVLVNAVETGDSSSVPWALEMVLLLTDKSERSALLQNLRTKSSYAVKGVVLAYSLSLGDLSVADAIDQRLDTKDLSPEEYQAISTALSELTQPEMKPFLIKWCACSNELISKSAYQTLVTFQDSTLVPTFVRALDHRDNLVRLRALHSLSKIEGARQKSGKPIQFTRDDQQEAIAAWKSWWKEEGEAKYRP